MNEISGFGSMQPLRSAGTARVCPQQQRQSSEIQTPEQHDQVSIGSHSALLANDSVTSTSNNSSSVTSNVADKVVLQSNKHNSSSQVQDFEGFLLAGSSSCSQAQTKAPAVQVSSLGTIAMIEEIDLPESSDVSVAMTLNGPSTVSEGIYSMSGVRLA